VMSRFDSSTRSTPSSPCISRSLLDTAIVFPDFVHCLSSPSHVPCSRRMAATSAKGSGNSLLSSRRGACPRASSAVKP
jgi:hypothetical protein